MDKQALLKLEAEAAEVWEQIGFCHARLKSIAEQRDAILLGDPQPDGTRQGTVINVPAAKITYAARIG